MCLKKAFCKASCLSFFLPLGPLGLRGVRCAFGGFRAWGQSPGFWAGPAADDINPALPIIRNIPYIP